MAEYTKTELTRFVSWATRGSKLNWQTLDRILELLKDAQWHSLKELEEKTTLQCDELDPVIKLFVELDFVSRGEEGSKVRIKPLGSKFMELPAESE